MPAPLSVTVDEELKGAEVVAVPFSLALYE
jgi:hypothetical protein